MHAKTLLLNPVSFRSVMIQLVGGAPNLNQIRLGSLVWKAVRITINDQMDRQAKTFMWINVSRRDELSVILGSRDRLKSRH